MKKKILAIALVAIMLFTFAACDESTPTAMYTHGGGTVPMFNESGISQVLVFKEGGEYKSYTSSFTSIIKDGVAYVYIMNSATTASTAANNFCSKVKGSSSGLLEKYVQLDAITDALLDKILGDLKNIDALIDTRVLASTKNTVLVSSFSFLNFNIVVVIPSVSEVLNISELISSWKPTGSGLESILKTLPGLFNN